MHCQVISGADFIRSTRWTASFFLQEEELESAFPLQPLRTIVRENKTAVDPRDLGYDQVNYLGLENVRPQSGELTNFQPRPATDIKSRSKTFQINNVLFGRLRPELNKVFLADGPVTSGICSNEFIVLVALPEFVLPRFLRHLLASSFVMSKCEKLRMGAALPRMNASDLLDIKVPVPPLDVQKQLVADLEALDEQLKELRRKVELLPSAMAEELLRVIADGDHKMQVDLT